MSDVQLLFLVLVLLYAWECACWVAHGTVVFRSWLGRAWHTAQPGTLLGNQRGGFMFAHPLPPLGTLLTAGTFPLALSPQSVLTESVDGVPRSARPAQSGRCLRWERIERVEANGKEVLVNGAPLLKAGSTMIAAQLAQLLRELKQAAAAERETLLQRALQEHFDVSRLEAHWQEFQAQTHALRFVTNALFAYLFVLAPAVIWRLGFQSAWLALLVGLLGLTSTTAILFHRAHKVLYPTAEDERLTHFLIILLSPATSIRANDVLSRPLLEDCHPLALAKRFCRPQHFRRLAQDFLRESRYPAGNARGRADPLAEETAQYWHKVLREKLEEFLKANGLDPDQLLQPPAPADSTSLAYCPRCLEQFATSEGRCEDCGGLALLPFPGSPS